MRQVTKNVFVETGIRGCNHGFVTTSDGIVMIDSPHKPSDALKLKAEIERRGGNLRYIINTEPHGDHWTGNAFFDVPVVAHEGVRRRILQTDLAEHVARVSTFGPDEPPLLVNYRPNAPVITFRNGMTLHVGNHTFEMIHMPGHTAPQTSVFVPSEGIVFTGDNVFHKCRTFVQEGDPWQWLEALESIRALDVETIVPGHGEPCDKSYLDHQGQILRDWVGAMETLVDKGMTEDEALKQPCPDVDPYPIGQHLFARNDFVTEANMRNVYRQITARRATPAG